MAEYTIVPPDTPAPSATASKYTIVPPDQAGALPSTEPPKPSFWQQVGSAITMQKPSAPPLDIGAIAKGVAGLPQEFARQAQLHQGQTLAQRVRDPAEQQRAMDIALSANPANLKSPVGIAETVRPTPTGPTPVGGVTPERAALAKVARDRYGIPVTAPDIGMGPAGKFAQSATRALPLSGVEGHELLKRQSFNRAVSQTFGQDATAITPGVMKAAKLQLGGAIDRIENANKVTLDNQAVTKLADLEAVAHAAMTDQEFGVVKRLLDNVIKHISPTDELAGTTVGDLLRKGGELDRAIGNTNRNIAHMAQGIRIVIQDALQTSLPPADAAAYRDARFKYKNMKTIEPLVNKSPTGDISPALLNARVTQQFKDRAYDVGGHDLDTLGKIGQAFLKPPPSSGSGERGAIYYSGAKIGELIAAVLSGHFLGIPATAAAAGGAIGAGRIAGKALRSPKLAEKTISRVLTPTPAPPPANIPGAIPAAAAFQSVARQQQQQRR